MHKTTSRRALAATTLTLLAAAGIGPGFGQERSGSDPDPAPEQHRSDDDALAALLAPPADEEPSEEESSNEEPAEAESQTASSDADDDEATPYAEVVPVEPIRAPQAEQTPPQASPSPTIEEIVVTARRKEERLQDVPLAITALGGEFLRDKAITRIDEIAKYVPSLHIDTFNTPTTTNIGVRGVRSANIAPGQDSAVGFYFGEVNYGYTIGIGQLLFDMQSVEVLKGPQGTLFGRNSTAGAVLATPAKPEPVFSAALGAGGTHFDGGTGFSGNAMLNLPLGDRLALRAAARVIGRDGFIDNLATPETSDSDGRFGMTNRDPLNDDETGAWRVSALWSPGDAFESLFVYQGSRLRTNGSGFSLNAVNPDPTSLVQLVFNGVTAPSINEAFERRQAQQAHNFWTTETEVGTFNSVDTHALSNATTWSLSDTLRLKNVAGYRRYELDDMTDFDGVPFLALTANLFDEGREWSEELQLQGTSFDGALDWVAGLYYSSQVIDHGSTNAYLRLPSNTDASHHDNTSYAGFLQGSYRFTAVDGLSLTAGARLTRDERSMRITQSSNGGQTCALEDDNGLPPPDCTLFGERAFTEPTYTVSLEYKPDASSLIYLAHRRGYRTGGFNYVGNSPRTLEFKPELVTDYELGFKRDWVVGNAALRSNLAIYHQDYAEIQRFVSLEVDPSQFAVVNAAAATISGGEIELSWLPTGQLTLSGFYSLTIADYEDFPTGQGNFKDNEFAQTPRHQYSVAANWALPLDPDLGDVSARADYGYQSHVFYTDTEQGDESAYGPRETQGQDAYGLLNFGLAWQSIMRGPFDVTLFVKNATNEEIKPFGVQLYGLLGTNTSTIGEPRLLGLELSYRFGE